MRCWAALGCALLVWGSASGSRAFCGFYVGESPELKNDATQVVLMRHGRRTVMSIQNNYEGPPEDFALVVPVPNVLSPDDVRTLPRGVFDRVDQLASPRLVEYWEQDPCGTPPSLRGLGALGTLGHGAGAGYGSGIASVPDRPVVRVEAEFAVDEYDITILSADDSTGLERWLRAHHYAIPRGASRALRPYVEAGTRFFVARVDASRLSFDGRRAELSPLRVSYESEELTLPIRLGLLNADGPQDLIVHVIAPRRYEVANRPNVTMPTNLRVRPSVRGGFGRFYAALFDRTLRENPGAVVTEYAWAPTSCDPCPGPVLGQTDLAQLGGDVMLGLTRPRPTPRLAHAGRYVSWSDPRGDDAEARRLVERALVRVEPSLDACVEREARSGRVPSSGGMQALVGVVLGSEPGSVVAVAGDAPAPLARCVRDRVGSVLPDWRGPPARVLLRLHASWAIPLTSLPPMTLTRLHTRYRPGERADDLVFRAAGGLVGGRGQPSARGQLDPSVASSGGAFSAFQSRYAILHEWAGPARCADPTPGRWGGPPGGSSPNVTAATDLGEVRRRRVNLSRLIVSPPEPRSRGKRAAPKPAP